MSGDSLMLHCIRWETRKAAWWMLLFGSLCAVAAVAAATDRWDDGVSLLPILIVAVAFLVTADLLVGDSAIEPTRFWLGKPLHRGVLLCAKLSVITVAFVLAPLSFQLLLQRMLGVPSDQALTDFARSFVRLIGWVTIGAAMGAASRSMRGVLMAALVVVAVSGLAGFFLAFGFDFAIAFSGAGGITGGASAPLGLVTAVELTANLSALLVTVWLFVRGRAVLAARCAIGVVVVVRLLLTALNAASGNVGHVRSVASDRLSIDSVSMAPGNRLRIAYHINGASDSTGVMVNPASALIEARTATRTDTLYATAVVDVNDSTPAGFDLRAMSRFDEQGRLLFREMLSKNGVLVVRRSDSLPIGNATLHISATATSFKLGPVFTAPLALGTLFRDSTRRLELFSQPGTNQRPILTLRLIDRNPATSPAASTYRSEIADVGALELFEFSVEPNPMNCCNPIRRIQGSTESASYILPGSQRTRTEADFGVPYEVAARGGTRLSWREWRFERHERLEASAPITRR